MFEAVAASASTSDLTVTMIFVSLFVGSALMVVWMVLEARKRHLVASASLAVGKLVQLNEVYESLTASHPLITLRLVESTRSKSQFDRFDLDVFLSRWVLEQELFVKTQIARRRDAMGQYAAYEIEAERLARETPGKSSHEGIAPDAFAKIERRILARRKLKSPTPQAKVRATVTYTSPQGRNSYAKTLEWDFEQLDAGLRAARQQRERQSTNQHLRQREREMMTDRVRMQILTRDDFRCRMCGASGGDGAELHIDHIVPVSHGGRTLAENLQVLCKPCDLGKSNRFVG